MQKIPDYSDLYRNQARKAVFSIMVFILIYLLILLLSISFVALILYTAFLLLKPSTVLFGLFLGFIGIVLLIFIIQFFFRKHTIDRSLWKEISKDEQPRLFELIESIASEIDTDLPQRVYLSPGVEASVFYDSNFWNLFFPSKENLVIGLGLINSTSESELKSIFAHEFGHFAQRGLKIFSYVYIENQIIYKMLIDDEYYFSLISKYNKGFFIWIIIGYAKFIKWILRKAYEIVHLNYMSLSREMEYHADEISAYISGTIPNVTSLLRYELASSTYNYLGEFYFNLAAENIKTNNIYPQHYYAMISSAREYGAEIEDNLPIITKKIINRFNRSKLVIRDQWASHPSIPDRIARFENLNIEVPVSNNLAWDLIDNRESVQIELTNKLFKMFSYSEEPKNLSLQEFWERYDQELARYKFDKRYNYFYNTKDISEFDIDKVTENDSKSIFSDFQEIYTSENVELVLKFTGLGNDIKMLESIERKEISTDSFEYDGEKYHAKESKGLIEKLMREHKDLFDAVKNLDMNIYKFFFSKAYKVGLQDEFKKKYKMYFDILKKDKENLQLYLDMIMSMQFMIQFRSYDNIKKHIAELKKKETLFRERFESILKNDFYETLIENDKREKIEKYLSKDWIYFKQPDYDSEALSMLEESIYLFYSICSRAPFAALVALLDFQIKLMDQ
jgi:Zn-dependent protease with chaperone function